MTPRSADSPFGVNDAALKRLRTATPGWFSWRCSIRAATGKTRLLVPFPFLFALAGLLAFGAQHSAGQLARADDRLEFLQKNFAKFVPVQFQKTTNSQAAVQCLHVRENLFEYNGQYYCGFRFSTPSWLDGDFAWIFLMAKTQEQKDFQSAHLGWFILPETGKTAGFEDFTTRPLSKYAALQGQFPYTHNVTIQHCDFRRLVPGKNYAIWFSFAEKEWPDLAFAMTIRSPRGESEFGILPLK
jgi:hypothetical protein